MYKNFRVRYQNGVTRVFFDSDKDVRYAAEFYENSFGRIVEGPTPIEPQDLRNRENQTSRIGAVRTGR